MSYENELEIIRAQLERIFLDDKVSSSDILKVEDALEYLAEKVGGDLLGVYY